MKSGFKTYLVSKTAKGVPFLDIPLPHIDISINQTRCGCLSFPRCICVVCVWILEGCTRTNCICVAHRRVCILLISTNTTVYTLTQLLIFFGCSFHASIISSFLLLFDWTQYPTDVMQCKNNNALWSADGRINIRVRWSGLTAVGMNQMLT